MESVKVNEHSLSVSRLIGVGVYPCDGVEFDTLLKHAHAAADSAKEARRNTYRFFSREMNAGLVDQFRLSGGLTPCASSNLCSTISRRSISTAIVSMEQKLQHPEDGLLAPDRFISLSEWSGHKNEAQGGLFSRPVAADKLTELLKKHVEELH